MNDECCKQGGSLLAKAKQHPRCAAKAMACSEAVIDEVSDTVKALMQTEVSYRTVQVRQRPAEWRRKIGQWAYRVIDHFGVDREVVSIAMNLLDRFLMESLNNSRKYQLTAMTCLYIALKLHTRSYRKHLRVLTELSRGQFIEADILASEGIVLQTLDYRVHPPTPITFVRYFMQYYECHRRTNSPTYDLDESRHDEDDSSTDSSTVWHVVHEIARYGTELAVLDVSCCAESSQLAYACILAAMDALTEDALSETLRHEVCETLSPLIQHRAPQSHLVANLAKLLSPELLVLEHHTSHPIAMAWDRHWLRCGDSALSKTTVCRNATTVESPVSVL